MNTIGFPGLGIESFTINPVAFTIPIIGLDILWYGIIVTLGILTGIFYSFWRGAKSEGISSDDMIDCAIFSIPAAMIGARVYYILFNLGNFKTFGSYFNIRNGGLAVYGGVIAGLAVGFAVCRFKKISFLKVFDAVSPGIMLGQVIGRWGNFTNAEAYGSATTLPWRMYIESSSIGPYYKGEVHPTFLYESLWNLIGFIIISLLYKRKKFDGQIFLMYITWYGLGRMFIEGLRTDSLMLGELRVSQVLGGLCFVGGLIFIILLAGKAKIKTLENDAGYEGVYSSAIAKVSEQSEKAEAIETVKESAETDENKENEDKES